MRLRKMAFYSLLSAVSSPYRVDKMTKNVEPSESAEAPDIGEQHDAVLEDRTDEGSSEKSSVADKASDRKSSTSQNEQRMYQAIARVQGELVGEGRELFLVTDSDKARFSVSGTRPGKLAVRLIATPSEERKGFISFWPRSDDSIVLASFMPPDEYAPSPLGPEPDEMLLSGKVRSCHSDRFTVQIKRNKGSGRGSKKFKGTVVTVSSSPPSSIQAGQWVELKLQRNGEKWILPTESETE